MKKALVILADGCEELEAISITDILTRADIHVTIAGLTDTVIKASRGATLMADTLFQSVLADEFDLIALPGGLPGAQYLSEDTRVINLVQAQIDRGAYVAAICAAPMVLAKANRLEGFAYTCYPGSLDSLSPETPSTNGTIEINDNIITGRGPGVALDFALTIVQLLAGAEKRQQVESALCR